MESCFVGNIKDESDFDGQSPVHLAVTRRLHRTSRQTTSPAEPAKAKLSSSRMFGTGCAGTYNVTRRGEATACGRVAATAS